MYVSVTFATFPRDPRFYHPITCSAHGYALLVRMDIKMWGCA